MLICIMMTLCLKVCWRRNSFKSTVQYKHKKTCRYFYTGKLSYSLCASQPISERYSDTKIFMISFFRFNLRIPGSQKQNRNTILGQVQKAIFSQEIMDKTVYRRHKGILNTVPSHPVDLTWVTQDTYLQWVCFRFSTSTLDFLWVKQKECLLM